jgi:lipoprotein-releasing system permease protein
MYKFFLTLRYLRTRRIAYFSMLAIALAVGMVLVVYSVMTGFLHEVERNTRNISGELIMEAGGLTTFPCYDEFIARALAALPADIAAMTPVVSGHGLLKMLDEEGSEKDRTVVVDVQGIRLSEYAAVTPFRQSLFYEPNFPGTTTFTAAPMPTWWRDEMGRVRLPAVYEEARARYCETADDPGLCMAGLGGQGYGPGPGRFAAELPGVQDSPDHRGRPRPGAVLGIDLVVLRQDEEVMRLFPKGTEVNLTMLVPTRSGKVSPDSGRTLTVRYVDDSYTRVFQVDSRVVYCDFDWLQGMLDLDAKLRVDGQGLSPPRASRIQIKLAAGRDPREVRQNLWLEWQELVEECGSILGAADQAALERVRILTWDEKHADFIAPVRNERVLMMVLFGLVSGVAFLVVGCVFFMIAQDKSREIGIIKSMGASARGVAGIFVVYALGMGLAGSIVGTVLGACFVWKINELQDFLASLHPDLKVWSPEVFAFERIPSSVNLWDAACIMLVAMVASAAGSLAAARRAARVWPVQVLRYE